MNQVQRFSGEREGREWNKALWRAQGRDDHRRINRQCPTGIDTRRGLGVEYRDPSSIV